MFFGVSHMVAATAMPISACSWPDRWRPAAPAEQLIVDVKKSGYLFSRHEDHEFVLLRHEDPSPSVELISYGATSGHPGHYMPVFGQTAWQQVALQVKTPVDGPAWPELPDVGYFGDIDHSLLATAIHVDDLADSRRFWCDGAGFRLQAQSDDALLLSFPALMSGWKLDIALVAGGNRGERSGMLDDAGWNCLSLLVDDLEGAAQRLCQNGGKDQTDVIRVAVGGRQLDILFLRGPSGEIVELLDLKTVGRPPNRRH